MSAVSDGDYYSAAFVSSTFWEAPLWFTLPVLVSSKTKAIDLLKEKVVASEISYKINELSQDAKVQSARVTSFNHRKSASRSTVPPKQSHGLLGGKLVLASSGRSMLIPFILLIPFICRNLHL
jgi:hypothetical protein